MARPRPLPDQEGYYGPYGGRFVPETLMAPVAELIRIYDRARRSRAFRRELTGLLNDFAGRPTPLYFAERLSEELGGARLFFKREDLLHTGAHKINNALGQCLLTRLMEKERVVAETGAGQHGVATATAAAVLGLTCVVYMGSEDMRRQRVKDGRLRPVRRFVYAIAGAPPSWFQTVLAAVLAAGPEAVASDVTAGALWYLKHCDEGARESRIHVIVPQQVRLQGVTGHLRALGTGQRVKRNGIPVTNPERTLVDLAATLCAAELGECVDDALRRDLIRLDRLRHVADGAGRSGWRRLRSLRLVLADRIPGYDAGGSDWEREMDRLWEAWGLPRSVRQHRVRANGHTYVLDRAIPALKIGIEWNGFETHGTRSGFDRDSDRRADLTAEGWHMVDFTSRSSQDRICRAVLAAVAKQQRPALGA